MKQNFVKRLLTVALVLCMVCSMALAVSADEVNTATLSLSVSRSGNTITASVALSASSDLLAAEFKVNFDNTKMSLTESSATGFPNKTVNSNANEKGFVKYVGYSDSAVSVSGTVLTMKFTVNDSASGDVSFSISGASVIDANDQDCTVTVSGGGSLEVADYKVTVNSATNGTVSSNVSASASGKTITLTTAPAAGYAVDTVSVVTADGSAVSVTSNGNTHTFTMPKANVTVTATFKAVPYTVTAPAAANGKVSVDKATAFIGETVTITATPNEGYEVASVSVAGVNVSGGTNGVYTFTMPAANVTVNVTFQEKTFAVKTGTTTNGTVTVSSNRIAFGKTVTVTTAPAAGYAVEAVTATAADGTKITVKGSGNTYTFTMPASDVTVTATFKAVPYTVTVAAASNGKATVDKTAATVGETVTITATANEFYEIASVSVSGATVSGGSNGVYTFKMPAANATVTVTFKAKSFTISQAKNIKNGTVSVASSAAYDSTVTVTANPAIGYQLDKFVVTSNGKKLDVTVSGNTCTFKMPGNDVTVDAEFKKADYKVNVSQTSHGSVSVNKNTAAYGDTITITVKADNKYELEYISVVDVNNKKVTLKQNKNGTYSFTMPDSDVKITAGFAAKSYAIEVDAGNGGKVTAPSKAATGATVEVTVKADEGYVLESLKITSGSSDVSVTEKNGTYTFKMPGAKVSVKATFKAVDYKVNAKPAENGTFTISADQAKIGDKITVTAKADENYQVNAVVITDSKGNLVSYTGEGDVFSFEMPASDVTVQVTFEKIPDITYGVTAAPAQNGQVTLSKDNAGAGSVVTITCTPDVGYMVDTVTVTDAEGNAVEVSGSENVYAFAMPETEASVSVTFKEDPNYVEEVPTTAPEATEAPDNTPASNPTTWIIPGAILVLVVAILVTIIVILTKKKK